MSRPLTGRVTANSSGTFTASLPATKGAKKRIPNTFPTKRAAEASLLQAVAAREAGLPVPAPNGATGTTRTKRPSGTRFITMAERWIQERYVEDKHGEIDREKQIRRQVEAIDAYMTKHNLYLETVTYDHVRTMFGSFLKDSSESVAVPLPHGVDPNSLVTMKQAVTCLNTHALACSESTFKRAKRSGCLAPAGKSGRAQVYRLGDLFEPELRLVKPAADGPRYARSTLTDVRRSFNQVLNYAERKRGIILQPQVRDAELPANNTEAPKTRALTLRETGRIAARLHVVHQLALWLLFLCGLRISEAYGLLVEDVIDAGAGRPGLLTVQSQGGRKFRRRGQDGTDQTSDHIDETKANSWRVLVIPAPMMDLIRVVIDTFHTGPEGATREKARLIPGLRVEDKGGQSAFRNALGVAAEAEGLNMVIDHKRHRSQRDMPNVTPRPHDLRKSFATGRLASSEAVEDIRAFLGHRRGNEVIHAHYLLEDPEMKARRRIAKKLHKEILKKLPDGLMIPTAVSATTGRQPALARRAAEIDAHLIAVGWLVQQRPEEAWISVAEAAELRGVSAAQIRDDIHAERLRAIKVARPDQASFRYLVDSGAVLAMAEVLGAGSGMRRLAEELGEPYDKVRQYIRRNADLHCEPLGQRDYHVPDDVAEQVREYFRGQQELAERALRMPEVSKQLGISVAAVSTLINHGKLHEDERFHGGVRSVTADSLKAYQRRPRR